MNQKIICLGLALFSVLFSDAQGFGEPPGFPDTALVQSPYVQLEQAHTNSLYLGGAWNPNLPGYQYAQLAWQQKATRRSCFRLIFSTTSFAGTRCYRLVGRVQKRFGNVTASLGFDFGKQDPGGDYARQKGLGIRAVLGIPAGHRWRVFMDLKKNLGTMEQQDRLNLHMFFQASQRLKLAGAFQLATYRPILHLQSWYTVQKQFVIGFRAASNASLGLLLQYRKGPFRFSLTLNHQSLLGFRPSHALSYRYD